MPPKYEFRAEDIIQQGRIQQENLERLRSLCIAQNMPPMSDEQLILFLLFGDDMVEVARNTITAYFKCKKNAPELFYNRNIDSESFKKTLDICEAALLPVRTRDNDAVMFGRLKDTSFTKYNFGGLIKLSAMIAELPLHKNPPDGVVGVMDFKGIGLRHLLKMKLSIVRTILQYIQEGFPCKLKQIHILNSVGCIDKIIRLLKPFVKKEPLELIEFHQPNIDMNDFFERFLPADCIPEDYGGTLPSLKIMSMVTYQEMRAMETFYKDEEEQIKSFIL
ncbi:CRAL TRIO domain containing protein [Asbolus verrucosus]|uniref:CRAL TRIO domain containing protein n=1 Tax=Asbolus verrucosus TaxID=1661398 RepID=A0A482VAE0_ASBVE|nr:CRAL TRIO domain containing protein [Asbolus verrucosus]